MNVLRAVLVLALLAAAGFMGARALVDPDRLYSEADVLLDHYSGNTSDLLRARNKLRLALALHPEHAQSWVGLSRVARRMAYVSYDEYDPEGMRLAHQLVRRALERDPRCWEALMTESTTYLLEHDVAKAEEWIRKADALRPGDVGSDDVWASIDLEARRYDSARAHLNAVLERSNDPVLLGAAYQNLLVIQKTQEDWSGADSSYRALMGIQPTSAWVRGNYANFLLHLERFDEAIEWADTALAMMDYGMAHRTRAEARYWRAMRWIETVGRWWEAYVEFQVCVQDDPSYALGWYGVAFVERGRYEHSGKSEYLDASVAALRKAQALDPKNEEIRELAEINAGNGRLLR
jgi:Tfp pilus assembly protein PilF